MWFYAGAHADPYFLHERCLCKQAHLHLLIGLFQQQWMGTLSFFLAEQSSSKVTVQKNQHSSVRISGCHCFCFIHSCSCPVRAPSVVLGNGKYTVGHLSCRSPPCSGRWIVVVNTGGWSNNVCTQSGWCGKSISSNRKTDRSLMVDVTRGRQLYLRGSFYVLWSIFHSLQTTDEWTSDHVFLNFQYIDGILR